MEPVGFVARVREEMHGCPSSPGAGSIGRVITLIFKGAQLEVGLRTHFCLSVGDDLRSQSCVTAQSLHNFNRLADRLRHQMKELLHAPNCPIFPSFIPLHLHCSHPPDRMGHWRTMGPLSVAGCALFWAIVALLIHDVAMTLVAGFSAYRAAMYVKHKERKW